jgi:TonB family protein
MNWKPSYGDDDGISPRLFRAKERWAKAFHAFYSFEGDKNEETLDILPVGHHSPSLQNKLHLPLVPEWHCQSEIQNRCLIAAMEKITYPQGVLKARASGVVELTGTVDRNGRVTGVHVVDASVRLGAEKAQLANEAARDLKTWRFDAGGHDDPIRIVYSFEFDASLPRGGRAEVEWVSPNQVKVRANSPK